MATDDDDDEISNSYLNVLDTGKASYVDWTKTAAVE